MKIIQKNKFILILLLLTTIGCEDAYKEGFKEGRELGYYRGLREGQSEGWKIGQQEGLKNGEDAAMRDIKNGNPIRLYYPFMIYSFVVIFVLFVLLQIIAKRHLAKTKKMTTVHKLLIPGIQYSDAYLFLEDFHNTFYNSLLKDVSKIVFSMVASQKETEQKLIEIENKKKIHKKQIEAVDELEDALEEKIIEQAKKDFDKIIDEELIVHQAETAEKTIKNEEE